jgi:hypothetical protein
MLLASFFLCVLTLQAYAVPGGWTGSPPIDDEFGLQNYWEKFGWFTRFADAFTYPNNTIQAKSINSTLFSETVQGRVDATTNFYGRELNTEVSPPFTIY